jgi:hypothetical protein
MNADFFNCVMCTTIVEVQNSAQDVPVVWDEKLQGWRIICDTCVLKCKAVMHPVMLINYGMLKEKPRAANRLTLN